MGRAIWLSMLAFAAAAAPVTVGPWSLEATPDGPRALSYRGQALVSTVSVSGFTPNWERGRFALTGAVPEQGEEGHVITWRRDIPGQAVMALTVRLGDETATLSLEADVQPAGPCEFGLYLEPEPLIGGDTPVLVSRDGQSEELGPSPMRQSQVAKALVFERPGIAFEWACTSTPGAFALQDWRQRQPAALRLITVAPVADTVTHVSAAVSLRVRAYDAAEASRRDRALFQKTLWRSALELGNAGFEDGLAGWTAGSTGSVAEDVHRGGQRSARLVVADPMTESVYITRQVPVVGGAFYDASCQVRTQGVVAKPGKMASVGAGLIVEWATPKGEWFGAGEYACNRFGDHDWQEVSCTSLRAPEEAGFAVVFLALRGAGTAWFDDLSVVQTHRSVALVSPEPGSVLADNTPTLAWRGAFQAAGFTVDISREPTFPAAATQAIEAQESPLTLRTPISPGTWYWRVRAPGFEPSVVWDFEQTAPADRDTTAPVLLTRACRATAADGEVQIEVEEDTAPPPAVAAHAGPLPIAAVRQATREGRHRLLVRPEGTWQNGLNPVTVTLTDAAGNRSEGIVQVAFQPVPENAVTIRRDGAYESAGSRVFPLGIYQVSPAAMPAVRAAGFEVVHSYQWESSQDDEAARAYLDAAWQNGLRVFIGFDRGRGSGRGLVQGNTEHVARRVAALSGHPGLFCWYLFDEPEIPDQYVSPRNLTGFADLIRALDPYHPVVVTTWGNRMNRYRASWDTHWTQSYSRPAEVVRTLAEHRRLLENASPITLLVHCYDQGQTPAFKAGLAVDPAAFQPDGAWMRAAAFAGITKQVNGLFWWWYADGNRDYYTVAHVPQAWQALGEVVRQVRELRPALTASGPAETATLATDGGAIELWAKTTDGERTVIAVHTGEKEVTVAIPGPGQGQATVLFEDRQVLRQNGAIRDAFGRYGVHVYRFRE